jgi:hypothetical protein
MTLQEIIDTVRRRLGDYEKPYDWTDQELVDYANDIENIICREARVLIDPYTSAICSFYTVAEQFDYVLSPLIIEILNAKIVRANSESLLTKYTAAELYLLSQSWRTSSTAVTYTHDEDDNVSFYPPGSYGEELSYAEEPTKYCLDYRNGYITLYPAPDDVYAIQLSVIRYPLTALTTTSMSAQTSEIDAKYHHALIAGMCYHAYMKTGIETYNEKKSAMYYNQLYKYLSDMKSQKIFYEHTSRRAGPHLGCI